jgi:hypothetical protein
LAFSFQTTSAGVIRLPAKTRSPTFSSNGRQTRHRLVDIFTELWNSGVVDRSPGPQREFRPAGAWKMLYYDANGEEVWAEVGDFSFNYSVKRRAWL